MLNAACQQYAMDSAERERTVSSETHLEVSEALGRIGFLHSNEADLGSGLLVDVL